MSVVSVYCTFASREEAERIGRQLVDERLAACVNIVGGVRSIYRWQGAVETADEVAAIFKTTSAAADRLVARLGDLHTYDVPAITVWAAEKLPASFGQWIEESVAGDL